MTELVVKDSPLVVESRPMRVTLFEDRAEVLREVKLTVPEGAVWVQVEAISVAIDDASLVAGARGEKARVVAAKVVRRVRSVSVGGEGEREAAEADQKAARREESEAEAALSRAQSQRARVAAMQARWVEGVQRVPRGKEGAAEAGAHVWREAMRSFETALAGALDAEAKAYGDLKAAQDHRSRAEQRWRDAQVMVPKLEALLVLQVEASEAGEVVLEITYRTPCALWRPEHLARLVREEGRNEVVLETWATAWQATGEKWEGVRVRFSTARPAQSASAPLEREDVLFTRRKTDHERSTVQVAIREQSVQMAGLDRGSRDVDEMPGVEDGGEALWFEPEEVVTLPSDGSPHRVLLHTVKLSAAVDRVAFPEKSEAVHVRATATLAGAYPLLAGPVRVARGGALVGRARTDFVGRGEPFELGFGIEDGVRVRRRSEDKRDTTAVMGTQKLQRTVRVTLSNLSGESRSVTVVERFPVSEIEDVKVFPPNDPVWSVDGRDGIAKAQVTLGPRATQEIVLVWRLEATSRTALPF